MIKEVVVYQTKDGVQHPSRAKAEAHVLNMIREFLDKQYFKDLNKFLRRDSFGIIMELAGDLEKCECLYSFLHEVLSYDD